VVVNARGQAMIFGQQNPKPPLSKWGYQRDPAWQIYERDIEIPASFGQPRTVGVVAIVWGNSPLPVRGSASVRFGPAPYGPYSPTPPRAPTWQ
jgi:hypothetical protein